MVSWDIESQISQGQCADPDPRPGSQSTLYVPLSARAAVLEWAHSSPLFGHPGVKRTLEVLRQRFWWPSLENCTRAFISACEICARNKTSNRRPAGLLRPLPIPTRPWSHIALDFVTGLPLSHGMSVILTVVDRISKAAHLIALPKLPNSKETADLLVSNVFRLHGIPTDIVSDRGPQFISVVWKSFCKAIGASVSLSSGFHPQSNGQTERLNQEIESKDQASWSLHLPWVEYAHNSLVNSSTGISPFHCSLGYQPPLLSTEEKNIAVPSIKAHVERCHRIWSRARLPCFVLLSAPPTRPIVVAPLLRRILLAKRSF